MTQNATTVDMIREDKVTIGSGTITVKSPTFGGLKKCLALVKDGSLKMPPAKLSADWLADKLVQTDGTTDFDRLQQALADASELETTAIQQLILSVPELVTIIITDTTDRTEEQVDGMAAPDIVLLFAKALSLMDVKTTLEHAKGFFSDIGGLMEGFKAMQEAGKGGGESLGAEAKA